MTPPATAPPAEVAREPAARGAAETRDRILISACETIAEVGFEKVRMRMVADRAGVSTALLHYHFSNRETLFAEALRYTFEHSGRKQYEATPPNGESWAWRLARMIESSLPIDRALRQDSLLWEELWLRAARDPESRELAIRLYADTRAWLEAAIRQGTAAGEFADCDAAAVADLIVVLTDGYAVHLLLGDPLVDLSSATREIWGIVSARLGVTGPFPTR